MAAFLAAPPAMGESDRHFDCTGQVAYVCGNAPQEISTISRIGTSSKFQTTSFLFEHPGTRSIRSGDIIHIVGTRKPATPTMRSDTWVDDVMIAEEVEVIGHSDLPPMKPTTASQIDTGDESSNLARVSGIISSVMKDEMNPQWNWLVLRTKSGKVNVATTDYEYPYERLLSLTDAEASVGGRVMPQRRWRRFTGYYIRPLGEDGIKVTSAPPKPSSMKELTEEKIKFHLSPQGSPVPQHVHRRKVSGVILASSARFSFLQTSGGEIVKAFTLPGKDAPPRGTYTIVAGFAAQDFCGLIMSDAEFFQPDAPTDIHTSTADKTDIRSLFHAVKFAWIPDSTKIRRLVTLTGVVASSEESIRTTKTIRVESGEHYINVDISGLDKIDEPPIGSVVEVTGVGNAEFETDHSVATFPRFSGFSIIPMSAEDIVVVKSPPWWTTGRLMVLVLSLIGALAAVSVVAVVLKSMSDKRGRQLYEERVAHVRTEAKVEERTRLAVELHDAISQTLTGVALQVDSAAMANNGENKRLDAFLGNARHMLASCRRELQDCLWDLRTRTFAEKDMTEAILRTIAPHSGKADVSVRFNVPRKRLTESATHSILCIVRELVVNAIRHGKATKIAIAGEYHDGLITFSVRDNGCGFYTTSAPGPREGHFGLQGIHERVSNANGTIKMTSAPGSGTKTVISIRQA